MTSPYRQYIGLKGTMAALSSPFNNSNIELKLAETPHVYFKKGIKTYGINLITAICNHPYTTNDAYILTDNKEIMLYDTKNNINISLTDGYKLSNLHGQKGVINDILPSDRFKIYNESFTSDVFNFTETTFNKIDIIMNYDTLVERGAFGILTEASYSYNDPIDVNIDCDIKHIQAGYLYDKKLDEYYPAIFGIIHYMVLDNTPDTMHTKGGTLSPYGMVNLLARKYDNLIWQWVDTDEK